MKTVYLIRHATFSNPSSIVAGRLPLPLSEEGIAQASKLAAYLAEIPLGVIYSSQVLRCQQTAEIIQQTNSNEPPVIFDKRLLETQSAYQGYWEPNVFEG